MNARVAVFGCALGLALLQGCGGGGGSSSGGTPAAALTITVGGDPGNAGSTGGSCEGEDFPRECTVPSGEQYRQRWTIAADRVVYFSIEQGTCPEGVCCNMSVSGDLRRTDFILHETAVDPDTGLASLLATSSREGTITQTVEGLSACQFTLAQATGSNKDDPEFAHRFTVSGQPTHDHWGYDGDGNPHRHPLNVRWAGGMYNLLDTSRQGDTLAEDASISTLKYLAEGGLFDGESQVVHRAENPGSFDKAAVDAHGYTQVVHDYFKSQFGWNSYDNQGSSMFAVTGHPEDDNTLAFWDRRAAHFIVPMEDHPSASVALDIVAHEWGHALSDGLSTGGLGLRYERESGALEEAFADWVGAAAVHHHRGGHGRRIYYQGGSARAVWVGGGDGGWGQIMSDPHANKHPDTYMGTYWEPVDAASCPMPDGEENDNCYVHHNNGVGNKMFYLLSDGGRFGGERVAGIGIQNALRVAFDAHRDHWSEASDYAAARRGMVAAAQTLDRANGTRWADSVRAAWTAVGVDGP